MKHLVLIVLVLLSLDSVADPRNVLNHGAHFDGVTGSSDAIQTTIDIGPGTVLIPYTGNNYIVDKGIVVRPGVHLIVSEGVILEARTDVNVVELKADATYTGGMIYNSNADFSKILAYIHRTPADEIAGPNMRHNTLTGFNNVRLRGPSTDHPAGYGLVLHSDATRAPGAAVQYTYNQNISVYDVGTALRLWTESTDGANAFMAGNMIDGLFIDNSVYGVVLDATGDTSTVNRNTISNVRIQATVNQKRFLVVSDGCRGNMFPNWTLFDWWATDEEIALEFNSTGRGSNANQFHGNGLNAKQVYLNPAGRDRVDSQETPYRLPTIPSAYTPSAEMWGIGSLFVNTDVDQQNIMLSTGKVWQTIGGQTDPIEITTDTTLRHDELGEGVSYRNAEAVEKTTITLPRASPGLQGIFLSFKEPTTLKAADKNTFEDFGGFTASSPRAETNTYLHMTEKYSSVHLWSYWHGIWSIIHARGMPASIVMNDTP